MVINQKGEHTTYLQSTVDFEPGYWCDVKKKNRKEQNNYETKVMGFDDESITIWFSSPLSLVWPHIFNTADMGQQNQFLLHPEKSKYMKGKFHN